MKNLSLNTSTLLVTVFLITSCGGGGGGGDTSGGNTTTPPTVSISANPEKLYLGYQTNATVSYNFGNATSCSGSGSLPSSIGSGSSGGGSYGFSATTAGTFTFTITCTNSGGSNSASTTITVFERYYKQIETVINKNWDAEGFASIIDYSSGLGVVDYSGDGTNLLTVTAFEPSSSTFELNYSGATSRGNSFDFNLNFNDWNTSTTLWYDADDTSEPAYASITSSFADAVVSGYLTLPEYYASKGIEYVSSALVEIVRNNIYYVIPTNVGEFTDTSDMPTSGTVSKSFETLGYYLAAINQSNSLNYIVADGDGTLNFDFANNTVSGSITYDTFVPYVSFKNGTAVYNLITSIPATTITLEDGGINGNAFAAIVVIDDGTTKGRGIIKGHFYGPNADEIAVNIFLGDVNDNANDYFHFTAGGLGQ